MKVSPDEAAFLTKILREWDVSDHTRAVYADWLADRGRPEEYVVRHYPPANWVAVTANPDAATGDEPLCCQIPWLPGVHRTGWVSEAFEREHAHDLFAAVLARNGVALCPGCHGTPPSRRSAPCEACEAEPAEVPA